MSTEKESLVKELRNASSSGHGSAERQMTMKTGTKVSSRNNSAEADKLQSQKTYRPATIKKSIGGSKGKLKLSNVSESADRTLTLMAQHLLAIDAVRITKEKRVNRTAMGEYLVPPGAKPLTSLGDCLPAPSDYSPKVDLAKPAPPQYSIAGRYKATKPDYSASAADNDTSSPLTWKDKRITLKGKGKTRVFNIADDAHLNDSVGPAHYCVEHKKTGTSGPKWSTSSRYPEGVITGPPNRLVQPVDANGYGGPGPKYRPGSNCWGRGPHKSFGNGRRDCTKDTPGPAEYTIEGATPEGPAYTLAKRLPPPLQWQQAINKDSPGPGAYDIGTTVGKVVAKSITGRHVEEEKCWGPAPNLYSLPDNITDVPTAPLTYRPFERNEGPHPGPTKYSITNTHLPKAAAYSMRKTGKASFPDILNYPIIAQLHKTPGPGHYQDNRNASKNDEPKFSIGKRAKSAKNSVPGPNHYAVREAHRLDCKSPPSYSMGRRVKPVDNRISPGPASYYPQVSSDSKGYSMSGRPKSSKKFVTPAPDNYNLSKGQTVKGVSHGGAASFKSRASPYVYSGFQATQVLA